MKKVRLTKVAAAAKRARMNSFHQRRDERGRVISVYEAATSVPHPDELVGKSNGELAQLFNVPANYVPVIRDGLNDQLSPTATGERDVWSEWQANNGGG